MRRMLFLAGCALVAATCLAPDIAEAQEQVGDEPDRTRVELSIGKEVTVTTKDGRPASVAREQFRLRLSLGPNALRDLAVAMIKDLRRSADYLRMRPDIDSDWLAYFGVSLGARLGNLSLAIEPRFKIAVLWSGGFRTSVAPPLPEIDEINFASRAKTNVLMLNGREDFNLPVETSQAVMFRLLGAPAANKKHVIYEGGHVFPFGRVIEDTLDWLDQYPGVPR